MARHLGQIPQGAAGQPLPPPAVIAEDFFTYNTRFEDLAAGATGANFIQIEADSDFLIQKLAYASFLNDEAVTVESQDIPLVTVLIVDTGSGRQIMNAPVPISALFGDGRLPYILPTPKLFTKNSRINVTVSNFGSEDYADIWLNFEGKKIFTRG
jgi:hypothetical protein